MWGANPVIEGINKIIILGSIIISNLPTLYYEDSYNIPTHPRGWGYRVLGM